ncbi:MAG: Rpn family recombination-promoting nuclease/putative transposase [Bifidobacteriaceae bacterium]|jgi:predicted transposase/invertase (TIGR01784 family)|nr:Rpn family recombination-promoting nuclease/putative transposase [Bifidobacteriaceae bacterium]
MKENLKKMDQIILKKREYYYLNHYLVFKWFFGTEENKAFLASLLFSILGGDKSDFDELQYLDPNNIGDSIDEKYTEMDIFVQDKTGRLINLEMQNYSQSDLAERMVYYGFRLIVSQSIKGKPYSELKPAVSIWITSHIPWEEDDDVIHSYKLLAVKRYTNLTELFNIVTLSPDKIKIDELPNIGSAQPSIEFWLAFVGAQSKEELMAIAQKSSIIDQAWSKMNDYNISFADRLAAMSVFKREQDMASLKANVRIAKQQGLEQGLQQGKQEGLEQGLQQGEQNKQREIAQAMLKRGMNLDDIVAVTGLTLDQLT